MSLIHNEKLSIIFQDELSEELSKDPLEDNTFSML
jgi:hypothetical protein